MMAIEIASESRRLDPQATYAQLRLPWPLVQEYLGSLNPATRGVMLGRLRAMAKLLDAEYDGFAWHELTAERVKSIRAAMLTRGRAPGTINIGLAALRGLARTAYDLGMIGYDRYHELTEVRNCRTEPAPLGRAATTKELAALFAVCMRDPTAAGVRDNALLAALYAGALQCRELVELDLGDYLPEPPSLRIRSPDEYKRRTVLLGYRAADALAGWVAIRGGQPGHLFLPVNKCGRIVGERMSAKAVYGVVSKRAAQAGLDPLTPQDIRHTAIRDLWDEGANLPILRRIAGQASILTAERYCRHRPRRGDRVAWHRETPYHKW